MFHPRDVTYDLSTFAALAKIEAIFSTVTGSSNLIKINCRYRLIICFLTLGPDVFQDSGIDGGGGIPER